jgi:hypothetical protein
MRSRTECDGKFGPAKNRNLAPHLVANDKMIPIDDKDVSAEARKTDKYREIRERMERNLALPEKRHRYGTHEAGHLIQLIENGLIDSPDDAVFAGPTIYSDGDEIGYFMAAVTSERIRLSDNSLVYTEDLLNRISLVAAAGTVFETELHGTDEETANAARGDEHHLHKHCYKAFTRFGISFTGYTLWPSAKRQIAERFRQDRDGLELKIEAARPVILAKCFKLPRP